MFGIETLANIVLNHIVIIYLLTEIENVEKKEIDRKGRNEGRKWVESKGKENECDK